mgnify:CR=1 FL=1
MRGIARIGDSTFGTCYAHKHPLAIGGTIISASPDHVCNGRLVARLGDTVLADCGHTAIIVSASTNTACNNRGVARLGDSTAGAYVATIISASMDSDCN